MATTIMMMIKEPVVAPSTDPEADTTADRIIGVLLAAGAGRRAGGPKALRVDPDGTSWLLRSITVLREGGCDAVVVVLGSEADRATDVLASSGFASDPGLTVVDAPDWQLGMGSSLRRGLLAAQRDPMAALARTVPGAFKGVTAVNVLPTDDAPPEPPEGEMVVPVTRA